MNNDEQIPILNEERRFLFNQMSDLTHKEKMQIVAPINGKKRSKQTIKEL